MLSEATKKNEGNFSFLGKMREMGLGQHNFYCDYNSYSLSFVCHADALGAALSSHLDKPRVYIGCMKSGEVFSEPWVTKNVVSYSFSGNKMLFHYYLSNTQVINILQDA